MKSSFNWRISLKILELCMTSRILKKRLETIWWDKGWLFLNLLIGERTMIQKNGGPLMISKFFVLPTGTRWKDYLKLFCHISLGDWNFRSTFPSHTPIQFTRQNTSVSKFPAPWHTKVQRFGDEQNDISLFLPESYPFIYFYTIIVSSIGKCLLIY